MTPRESEARIFMTDMLSLGLARVSGTAAPSPLPA